MEPLRPASRRRIALPVLAAALVGAAALAPPASADPEPSTRELRTRAYKLADQLEQLTERYNGLRVRMQQSQRAAKLAAESARRQEKTLTVLRDEFSGLAATTYMQGSGDPTASFVAAQDPQTVLDQSATLRYFATRDGDQIQQLMRAMQAAERSRRAAEERTRQVRGLRSELDAQRKQITGLYEKTRGTLVKRDPSELAKLPVVGDGKGAQALRIAMTKLGRPYVWGGAGPSVFDCSGLTMWAYRQVGISLPHYTGSQWNAGTRIPRDKLKPGDLIFFHADLHHMGMYVGNGKMLHAPHTGDVVKIAPIAGRPYAGAVRVA
ncbi:C40 family peptidase [Actinomadura flavalba]|uniref:C40 family peptidase n=1 Tax=Actinomadura flavalba TaxID=1120938 RepID=UPI00039D0240|nr:NlpC/P60 family protein [Actinomadura flavalba]